MVLGHGVQSLIEMFNTLDHGLFFFSTGFISLRSGVSVYIPDALSAHSVHNTPILCNFDSFGAESSIEFCTGNS